MPSPDVLEAAGQRAAFRPVPMPQSVDALEQEVGRRRTKKRRIVGGSVAALALVLALPLGASLIGDDQPDVVTLASEGDAGDQVSAAPVAVQPAETSSSTTSSTTVAEAEEGFGPFAGLDDENFDLELKFGDMSFSIEVITGGDASQKAAAAEAAADSTRTIDDHTVWLDEQGDEVTAAAFYDGDTFVQVTGPTDEIDKILELVTEHSNGPLTFFDADEFAERFDLPEGIFDDDFTFGEDFPFGKDGPFGEDFPFDPESFFDDGALDDFRAQMEEFSECMTVTVDESGETTKIEIPNCDFPDIDGLVSPETFNGLFGTEGDIDLGDLFDTDDIENLLDDGAFDDLLEQFVDDLEDAGK